MIWSILAWCGEHVGPVLALGLFLAVGTWVISKAVIRLMLASEQRKESAQRQRLRSLQAAIELGEILKLQRGRTVPRAAGLHKDSRRIS